MRRIAGEGGSTGVVGIEGSLAAEKVEEGASFLDNINPESLTVLKGCRAEPSLAQAQPEERFQFEREGYFCLDSMQTPGNNPIYNRTITLRDTWAKLAKRNK